MIQLKKMQLINWHYFEFETIPFGTVNFLTGKNASGKTTIIDAIQLVMLGDTSGHFFNKSASEKSSRTLNGYLRCEVGTDDYGNPTYKRSGHFYSYVMGEFYDDVSNYSFVLGIVFENFDDATFVSKFFTYDDAIPENQFLIKRFPVALKDLRTYVYDEKGKEVTLFETNTGYRDFLRHKFGNIGSNFFSLFKKAIPFAPITNIETFINEYVCDVENEIDLDSMQDSIRKYTQLETEAANLEKRLSKLEEIQNLYKTWKDENERFLLKRYVYARCEKQVKATQLHDANERLSGAKEEIETYQTYLNKCRDKLKELEASKQRLLEEKAASNDVLQRSNLESQKEALEAKLQETKDNFAWAKQTLTSTIRQYDMLLDKLSNQLQPKEAELAKQAQGLLQDLRSMNLQENIAQIEEKQLVELQAKVNKLKSELNVFLRNIGMESTRLNEESNHLQNELKYLSSGRKMYDQKLLKLQELLVEQLSTKYMKKVKVEILADVLDIQSDTWRKVIENYLGSQRFYLFVEPKYVEDAIRIYESSRQTYGLYDVGVVDTEKIAALTPHIEKNALSEEIQTSNKYARVYIDNMIGNLIKCDNVDSLRSYRRSVTASGMLYQSYVARQLHLDRTSFYIGDNTIADTLQQKKEEFATKKALLDQLYTIIASCEALITTDFISGNDIFNIIHAFNGAPKITNMEEQIKNLVYKIKVHGSNDFLVHIDKNIAKNESETADLKAEEMEFVSSIARLKEVISRLEGTEIPTLKQAVKESENFLKVEFDDAKVRAQGEALFLEEMEHYKNTGAIFNAYGTSMQQMTQQQNRVFEKIISLRVMYNTEYHLDYEVNDRSNEFYQGEFDQLSTNALVDYQAKIKESKEVAMWQFKDNFLAKLKANFDMVHFQIGNLNFALANSKFGSDSYTFTVTPRHEFRDFYEMINDPLLLEGKEIFSPAFQEKYGDRLEELFSYITNVNYLSASSQSEIEQNITRYTDYRNYLKFDLVVSDAQGNKQQLSKTLLKKSGGETQTPFYISILASFSQLYKILEGGDRSNTIRLIVFDEAFSKMDSERIQESVRLLRNYSLQAIISAPPEKMPDIVPQVDETLCVVRGPEKSSVYRYTQAVKVG